MHRRCVPSTFVYLADRKRDSYPNAGIISVVRTFYAEGEVVSQMAAFVITA